MSAPMSDLRERVAIPWALTPAGQPVTVGIGVTQPKEGTVFRNHDARRSDEHTWDGKHKPAACKKINGSADFHTKSWSFRFECPECGASRRYNTNFLGSRYRLVCDGDKIARIHRDLAPAVEAPSH